MSGNHRKKRGVARATALLALVAMGLALVPQVALGQVPFSDADFSGYATGTYLHADALTLGSSPTVKADLGFSGASVASKGLTGTVTDQLGRVVQPAVPGKNSYGAGFGLDVGLLGSDLLQQQAAAAAAPPSTDLIEKTLIGPIDIPGILSAGVVEGKAQATYDPNTCILGKDLSYGQGDVANAALLTGSLLGGLGEGVGDILSAVLGTDPSNQDAGAVRSSSRTRLVPQTSASGEVVGPNLGLMTETRQTLAPVVLFQGVPGAELTIELLGEWVIQAVATGVPNQAYVSYQPGTAGETPVLKVTNTLPVAGDVVEGLTLTLNQLLGITPLPDLLSGDVLDLGLVDLALNQPPVVTTSADGTSAKGVVDVVRVRLLPEGEGLLGGLLGTTANLGLELADVRVGHMEVEAKVPAGGVVCPGLDVKKAANPEVVNAGDKFMYSITTTNPYDCTLTNNRVADAMTVPSNIPFTIGAQNPPASSTTANTVIWNDIGSIEPRGSKSVSFEVAVADNAADGNFVNKAEAVSNCALETAQGGTANIELRATDEIDKPRVQAKKAPVLPVTGGTTAFWTGMAVLLGAISVASAFGYRKLGGISQK